MLLRACSLLFAATCAAADRFESPGGVMKPAFSLLDEEKSTAGGLIARLGRGTKSPSNPLFGQTLPWEPRIDNGYANVVHDPQYSTKTPWRLWYDAFTSCNDKLRDDKMRYLHCGGGKRHHGGLYAESADGLRWTKVARCDTDHRAPHSKGWDGFGKGPFKYYNNFDAFMSPFPAEAGASKKAQRLEGRNHSRVFVCAFRRRY